MSLKIRGIVAILGAMAAASYAQDAPVLELSLNDAVERALKNNVGIAVQRFDPEAAAEGVRQARGAYDPVFASTLMDSSDASPATATYEGVTKLTMKRTVFNFGLSQAVPSGADVSLTFNNSRRESNSASERYSPAYSSVLSIGVTQPLARGFRIDNRRYQLRVAKVSREISDVQFRQTVITTVANVKQLYYDLIYAIDNLEAQRKNLTLASKLLDENRIRVKVGTMAPLDVVQAESEAASREADVIVAEAAVSQAEDDLKGQIFPRHESETWALRIVPTDRPTAEPKQIDVDAAIRTALEKRTDVVAAHKNLEIVEAGLSLARSNLLPAVDLIASYGMNGAGGRQILRDPAAEPPVSYIPGGYSDATSQVFGRDYPSWSIGVNLSYPLFNRSASAARARARISRDQTVASLRRLELQIAAEVRAAARAVETNYKLAEATGAARVLATRSLDAEDKRFSAGMSTNYLVTQKQRDLAVAAVQELRAIANYRKSVIAFERVQEAGGGLISFASTP
jgi:outer membrane protein